MIKSRTLKVFLNKFNLLLLSYGLILPLSGHADTPAFHLSAAPSNPVYVTNAPPDITPGIAATDIENSPIDTSDLWDRIRMGFGMDTLDSPLVLTHINWYAQRPDYVRRTVDRSRRYLYHILGEVEKRGMPTEIALLPMIESAFNPMAYSTSHASGIWQFIPSTGKNFGLKQTGWYDGRRDIVAATGAALDYLTKLHNQFGTWELALAAYNCGEGCVGRAIAKNQAQGLPTDYSSLNLPTETRHYVPKLLAIKQIIADPISVGFNLDSIPNQAYFTAVTLNKPIDVSLAAKLANMPVSDFVSLNPAFNKPVVRSDTPTQLLLPVDKADTFSNNLENYDRPLVSWQTYTAKIGERFSSIAKKFNVTVAWLKEHNPIQLSRKGKLTSEHTLMVPLKDNQEYRVAIADKTMPAVNSSTVLQKNTTPEPAIPKIKEIKVKTGDTLYTLAQRYQISVADLEKWNKIKHKHIKIGQTLMISSPESRQATSVKLTEQAKIKNSQADKQKKQAKPTTPFRYIVKKGDTLHSIAHKFDVAIDDIEQWNNLKHRTLKPGVKLILKSG